MIYRKRCDRENGLYVWDVFTGS